MHTFVTNTHAFWFKNGNDTLAEVFVSIRRKVNVHGSIQDL